MTGSASYRIVIALMVASIVPVSQAASVWPTNQGDELPRMDYSHSELSRCAIELKIC